MDANKKFFFKKHSNNQFKRKGGTIKKGKCTNSGPEQSFGASQPADTVYRILCPSRKIGSVIGKGGGIVKALREDTRAKITVADAVPAPGADERVIIIYSSGTKVAKKQNTDDDVAAGKLLEPHCAAQEALLKVHDRIVEEDLVEVAADDDNENNTITARLLVPNNMVGCVLGKGGDVIQRLRSGTGASIRVLPTDHLPPCAMDTDELVQISGKPDVTKRALYEVSTLLHQNPRKERPPSGIPMAYGGPHFHPPCVPDMHPPGNPIWPPRSSSSRGMPLMPWIERYEDQPPRLGPNSFNGVPPGHREEAAAEFSMKILCSSAKIGGVIGKGGFNVKQLQQETGASIHVEDASSELEERVIRVSAFEGLLNPRSQTIDAILLLQNKTSEFSEKGTITTRLLVPSNKVGCILGQGGQVINEMRRRTQADIRVFSKDEKPKCASEDEELVQISGNVGVTKDALAEIASRLRLRTLRDANAGTEPDPVGPEHRFGAAGGLPGRGPLLPITIGTGRPGGYEPIRGGYDYEPQGYPVPPGATRHSNASSHFDARMPNNAASSVMGSGGSSISHVGEVGGARFKFQDPQLGGSERVYHPERDYDLRGSSEHLTSTHGIMRSYATSSGRQNMNPQQGSYTSLNLHQSSHQNMNAQQSPYTQQSSHQNMMAQQSPYTQQSPYKNMNVQQNSYQNANAQQTSYSINAQQGAYPTINAPPQDGYHNISAQQGAFQY